MPLGHQSQKTEHHHGALFSLVGATSPNPFDREFFSGCALFKRFSHIHQSTHFQKPSFPSLNHLHYFSLFHDQACRKSRHPLSANFTLFVRRSQSRDQTKSPLGANPGCMSDCVCAGTEIRTPEANSLSCRLKRHE